MKNQLLWFLLAFVVLGTNAESQQLANPILFVTVVPNARDSATQTATFGSHLGGIDNALRGGDLWIRYPDGTLRNLTKAAGFGEDGLQGANAIAVREPSVHWNGTKALFSMVIGVPVNASDNTKFLWQIYEVSGFGKSEKVSITKIPNQPQANNVSAIYGTQDNIIFISDLTRLGSNADYVYLDENIGMQTNSGLWSMSVSDGTLNHLDHSPSGDFNPIIDMHGRVVFSRWDILQQDLVLGFRNLAFLTPGNFRDESASSTFSQTRSQQSHPEVNPILQRSGSSGYYDPPKDTSDPLSLNPLVDPRSPENFFPWTVNEDGSGAQIINHIGRHDLADTLPSSFTGDPSLTNFSAKSSSRANKNPIKNFLQIKIDPASPSSFYGVDAISANNHGAGQIVRISNLNPTQESREVTVEYITARQTRFFVGKGKTPPANHSGFYRNPLSTTDHILVASHSHNFYGDFPLLASKPIALAETDFKFRLAFLKKIGDSYRSTSEDYLTPGITKNLEQNVYAGGKSVKIETSGKLWEIDPVEVVSRSIPTTTKEATLDPIEASVFADEKVDVTKFRRFLQKSNSALLVTRNVTLRDLDDRQQPFALKVAGSTTQTPDVVGKKIYEVSEVQFYQADYLRGYSSITSKDPVFSKTKGRRVLAVPVHDVMNRQYTNVEGLITPKSSSVRISSDGSWAALVPAKRALSWHLTSPLGEPVVRERYWVNFNVGEIRTCAKCHGENQDAPSIFETMPKNKPEALAKLLKVWKQDNLPKTVALSLPKNLETEVLLPVNLQWLKAERSDQYVLTVFALDGVEKKELFAREVDANNLSYLLTDNQLPSWATQIYWEVRGVNEWGESEFVQRNVFSRNKVLGMGDLSDSPQLMVSPNPSSERLRFQAYSDLTGTCSADIISSVGSVMFTSSIESVNGTLENEIDVSGLPSGLYTLRIRQGSREFRRRVSIVH